MTWLLLLALAGQAPAAGLDLNRATPTEVARLPVPSQVAEDISRYLRERGRLADVYELMRVPGMTPELFAAVKPLVRVSPGEEDEYRTRMVYQLQRRLAAEDGPTAAAVELWQDMLLAPGDVNRARVEDLLVLDGVSLVDAVAIRRHVARGGVIRDRRDLAGRVPGLSGYGYRNLREFVAFDDQARYRFGGSFRTSFTTDFEGDSRFTEGDYASALATLDKDSAKFYAAGFTEAELDWWRQRLLAARAEVAGGANRSLLRNRLRVRAGRHLAVGGWLNQDFFQPGTVNDWRGQVELRELGPVRRAFLGDYRVTLGQGILLDNNAELRARTVERPEGLFNDLGLNRGATFRGGAAELGQGRATLVGFYSSTRRDAVLNPDSSANFLVNTEPRLSTFRDVLGETGYGGSLRWDFSELGFIPTGTRLAVNALGLAYDRPLRPDARFLDLPGDAHLLDDPNYTRLDTGATRQYYSADLRTVVENLSFEGELAMKPGGHPAFAGLGRARVQHENLYVTALYRHYQLGYDNPYNRGFCEQKRFEDTQLERPYRLIDPAFSAMQDYPMPKAEQGLYLETRYQVSRAITFTRAYVDVWRNLAWDANNARFQGEVEWRPVFPLRFRFRQKLQSKGLPKPVASTRSFTFESSIRAMASLSERDFLTAEMREGRIYLTPTLQYGDKASMSGNFLSVQWDRNFSEDFNFELGVATWLGRGMSQWILEDVGIDFLEGDGMRWYAAVSDRISDRLLVYMKLRHKTTFYYRTGLAEREGITLPGGEAVVRDFNGRTDGLGVSLQADLFW
ncbi:MAG: helix-hairpin-helix domain-containing protein [bacterium]